MNTTRDDLQISAFFDRCAEKRLMQEFEPSERETLNGFLLDWGISPGNRILEPGCGSGRLTEVLAEAVGPAGEIYAMDLSPAMIELARERGLPDHVHFDCGSAASIPREAACFDFVICLNVFPHFADKAAILREFARVLNPSGQLWVNHFSSREELNHFHLHAGEEVAHHMLPCADDMSAMMIAAGFRTVDLNEGSDFYSLRAARCP